MPSSAIIKYRQKLGSAPKLYLSQRALCDILHETVEHFGTETGGVLLGVRDGDSWYAIEALDPGPKAILSPSTFEYDHDYLTHLANKIARRYKTTLSLLGLWHRHPGSFDSFSRTDDETNQRYVDLRGEAAISGLVNVDPHFRMTFYLVAATPLLYTPMEIIEGDSHFPPKLFESWEIDNLQKRISPRALAVRTLPTMSSAAYSAQTAPTKHAPGFGQTAPIAKRARRGCLGLFFRQPRATATLTADQVDEDKSTPSSLAQSPEVLEMIDNELEYLLAQQDYSYELTPAASGVELKLSLANQLAGYPEKIEILFSMHDRKPVTVIGQNRYTYEKGIVEKYINSRIISNMSTPE